MDTSSQTSVQEQPAVHLTSQDATVVPTFRWPAKVGILLSLVIFLFGWYFVFVPAATMVLYYGSSSAGNANPDAGFGMLIIGLGGLGIIGLAWIGISILFLIRRLWKIALVYFALAGIIGVGFFVVIVTMYIHLGWVSLVVFEALPGLAWLYLSVYFCVVKVVPARFV